MKNLICLFSTALFVLFFSFSGFSQDIKQTIKGRIIDKDSQMPLPGANVAVVSLNAPLGTASDAEGYFSITDVPVGRHTIEARFVGYEPVIISELLVSSGKETVLNIELVESIVKLEDVVVKAQKTKGEAVNSMSMVSSRSFNVEETRRYAGGFDDPVRLASVYAGVASAGSVESNAIMIRGNSPVGVLWQIEGMVVPNPTHFANADILGGGSITMFSNQLLSNSDFYTGAFPAEMGNAYSGAFDVRFRDGNTENFEHVFQIGAMGIDVASEGPLSKNKRASYLFNYRYSTLGLVSQFLPEGEGLPIYQDLSYKIKFPLGENATISLWGIGGIDEFNKSAEEDPALWEYEAARRDITSDFKSGTTGLTYRKLFKNDAYLNLSFAASGYYQQNNAQWIEEDKTYTQLNRSTYSDTRYSAKALYNKKHNARLTSRYGLIYSLLGYNYDVNIVDETRTKLVRVSETKGNSSLWQFFAQTKYSFSKNLTLNAGLHSLHFDLNNKTTLEPRLGLKWKINPKHSLSAGYGLHEQQQLLSLYFIERTDAEKTIYPNKDLDFTQAQHFVLAYDFRLTENMRFRVEPYYQILSNLAVEENGPVAMINVETLHHFNKTLVSEGSGRNYGVDFTLERFLKNGFYYLATASVFESKYTGGDGIERNTRFNNNYLANLLAGKEWKIGKKQNQILGLNARFYMKGGDRLTPADVVASENAQEVEYDYSRAFENQAPTTYRLDMTANYQINRPGYALIFSVQINNMLASPTTYRDVYDYTLGTVREMQDGKPFPNMSLKIQF